MIAALLEDHELPAGVPRPRSRGAWTWVLSLGVHVVAVVIGGEWALRSMAEDAANRASRVEERTVSVELPTMMESSVVPSRAKESTRDPVGEVPHVSGGPTIARVDTGRDGRGGERTVAKAATHLSDVDERMRLLPGTLNRLDRDQVQRVRSQATRAAWEDRRSSREPMELAFLSPGDLARLERRTPSPVDPNRGVLVSRAASSPGGSLGASTEEGTELAGLLGVSHEGSRASSPGQGVRDGVPGEDHRAAAAVAHARPDVARAPVSVEAPVRGRVRDDVNSEQELANTVEALVHASTAGGLVAGHGVGGSEGAGAPGAGGLSGAGSHPTPLGDGANEWFDLSTTDPRLVAYFRKFHAKVDPLWANAFPRSAMLDLKQGTVILEVTIAKDGMAQVAWPPLRPSGIDEFDKNCAEAVRKASPFDAIPAELGVSVLHVRAPFVARNPIVH